MSFLFVAILYANVTLQIDKVLYPRKNLDIAILKYLLRLYNDYFGSTE